MGKKLYYVSDDTERAGMYECAACCNRFLHERIVPAMSCPYCGEEPDMEIGPDDEMPDMGAMAVLLQIIEGKEEVERYDALLSLAVTGGDEDWI